MKQLFLALAIVSLCFACKQAKETDPKKEVAEQPAVAQTPKYPAAVTKVLDAHGGLERWRQQKTLVYTVAKADNPEVHITDLHSRKDKIETKQYDLGFDGKQAWVLNKEGAYKGNPSFYHNLLFYFYAMPFVLADDGIVYGKTDDLVVNGKSYPGIMITYNNGVGLSYTDEYYLHYDPETYTMAWLGYTATFDSGQRSQKISWINYGQWETFNGVVLPTAITWHKYEGRTIKEARNTLNFENITLSTTAKPDGFYHKPEAGTFYVAEAAK